VREIVIELEHMQKIRRRTAVVSSFCVHCSEQADFVSLRDAARLFETGQDELEFRFRMNALHMQHLADGADAVCVVSLMEFIERRGYQQDRLMGLEISDTFAS